MPRRSSRSFRRAGALALCLPLLLAACSGDDDDSASAPTTTAAPVTATAPRAGRLATAKACDLLTPGDIEPFLDGVTIGAASRTESKGVVVCRYAPPIPRGQADTSVPVAEVVFSVLRRRASTTNFAEDNRAMGTAAKQKKVPGVGDEAVWFGDRMNLLRVRQGELAFTVDVNGFLTEDSGARLQQIAEKLARQVLSRLPADYDPSTDTRVPRTTVPSTTTTP